MLINWLQKKGFIKPQPVEREVILETQLTVANLFMEKYNNFLMWLDNMLINNHGEDLWKQWQSTNLRTVMHNVKQNSLASQALMFETLGPWAVAIMAYPKEEPMMKMAWLEKTGVSLTALSTAEKDKLFAYLRAFLEILDTLRTGK
jgi:hypothetical protein